MDFATPDSSVSAFCRAVISKVVPNGFWGQGESGVWNRDVILLHVDRFIRMRRSESLTLHEIIQKIKVRDLILTIVLSTDNI
jgi:telomerase reverse transcriptase